MRSSWSAIKYINGNYIVYNNGRTLVKRALRAGDDLIADFPDSIDLKITNKCSEGCPWCHESSIPGGESYNFEKLTQVLSELPKKPIEIAVGGGNLLEIPEETTKLIKWITERGWNPRITLNYRSILKAPEKIVKDLCYGIGAVGVSLEKFPEISKDDLDLETAISRRVGYIDIVLHIIAGVFPLEDLTKLLEEYHHPILILGYKTWGRGIQHKIPEDALKKTESIIKQHIWKMRKGEVPKITLGFDTLAIEQLGIRDCLSTTEWENIWLGPEGSCSMYVDSVKGEFSRTSRDPLRVSWEDTGILNFFKTL